MGPSSIVSPMQPPDMHAQLNEPQLQAVTHPHGPLLVLAGAGSGKTRVITYRVAHLLTAHTLAPYRILAVTFTNKAAREMRHRLETLVGASVVRDLWVGTFHATCARLIRRHCDALGLTRDFVIYDESDQRALMARVCKALELDDRSYPPRQLLHHIHRHKQQGTRPDGTGPSPFAPVLAEAYEAYQQQLSASNAADFEDLIVHIVRLVEDSACEAGRQLREQFEHILVDEFQDVNAMQYRLVRALAARHQNLCAVGDDDQSIYRWRGADVRIIRGFRRDFPSAEVVKLEQNYRSTANIVRAALCVIQPSCERVPKALFTHNAAGAPLQIFTARDEREEAAHVAQVVRTALVQGTGADHIAVFYRIHAQSRVLEDALRAENIAYQVVGGTRFFDRTEVKDLLAYLRLLLNPRSDIDLLRIINSPARGIGASTIDRITSAATTSALSILELLRTHLETCGLASAPAKRVAAFRRLIDDLSEQAEHMSPAELAALVLEESGYAHALEMQDNAEADARLENLAELIGSIREYEVEAQAAGETPSLGGYLERVSLVSDTDAAGAQQRVSLMTVHAAKGLEYSLVIVTGLEQGMFPYERKGELLSTAELEEERRLGYVALTRARDRLVLTHTLVRHIFGTAHYNPPSLFLSDLPADIVRSSTLAPTVGHRGPAPAPSAPSRLTGERYVERDVAECSAPEDDPQLTVGAAVCHKSFGHGHVRAVMDATADPTLLVYFPGRGEKRIKASFLAPA